MKKVLETKLNKLGEILEQKKALEAQEKELRTYIENYCAKYGIEKYEGNEYKLFYAPPKTAMKFVPSAFIKASEKIAEYKKIIDIFSEERTTKGVLRTTKLN